MKRTSLLCVLAVVALVAMAFPGYAAVELFRVGVQYTGSGTPEAPAYIGYTLNCTANITVEILPSDSTGYVALDTAGNPITPPVRTETLDAIPKGAHVYVWPGVKDDGLMAPVGYYVAKLTAQNVPAQVPGSDPPVYRWDPTIGLFVNYQRPEPVSEYPWRDSTDAVKLPTDAAGLHETIGGFYGIAVNKNVGSPYYGRIYVPHQTNRSIYMYDVDGTFLGRMNDDGISWFTSAPWDINIAEDDYVYVSDRSSMLNYCFKPDGSGWILQSPTLTNDRADFVRYYPANGNTYYFTTNGVTLYQSVINAAHTSWTGRTALGDLGSSEGLYGVWVSPDLLTAYCGSIAGGWTGVRKYTRTSITGSFTRVTTWTSPCDKVVDIEMGADGNLWVTENHGYVAANPGATPPVAEDCCIYKIDPANGAILGAYPVVSWGFMLSSDAVGNIACTFGKSSATWPGKYWGVFSTTDINTVVKQTSVFHLSADPAPVVVPGSEMWSYNTFGNKLVPNGIDTATVTFKVVDANGFGDIGAVNLDLKELKMAGDPAAIQAATVTQDLFDPNGTTANCSLTVSAVDGVPYGLRNIHVIVADGDIPANTNDANLKVDVANNTLVAYVKHSRSGANITGANIQAIGGVAGVYGYPFTYTSGTASDINGRVEMPISAGTFQLTAMMTGFKTQSPVSQVIGTVTDPPGTSYSVPSNLLLGPLSIAELHAYKNALVYCSVEGVCYAQPKGAGPTPAPGMDNRMESYTDATNYTNRKAWYMCDAGHPESGQLFYLKINDSSFDRQWDDSTAKAARTGNGLWIGKRPADGDTVCLTGYMETRPGYECMVKVDDGVLAIGTSNPNTYINAYYNLTQYGLVPSQPQTPVVHTPDWVYHAANVPWTEKWGTFAKLENVTALKYYADGRYAPDNGESPVDKIPYLVVADSANHWGTVAFQSASSYQMAVSSDICPVTIGDTYDFSGAVGRRCRYGEGTLRVIGTPGIQWKAAGTAGTVTPNSVARVRGLSGNAPVTFRGVVTMKYAADTSMWVENADRSVGVKVINAPWWIYEGDDVAVTGTVSLVGGVKQVLPTSTIIAVSTGNALPELGMRLRDVGGKDYGPSDPGIHMPQVAPATEYLGRGPLNVGLYVTVQGMVTYRDTSSSPAFFYVWDGSNMYVPGKFDSEALADGTGNKGMRIRHSGWMGTPLNRGLVKYQDFVTVKGVVSINTSAVPGAAIPEIIAKSVTVESAFPYRTAPTTRDGVAWNVLRNGANEISFPYTPAYAGNGADPALGTNPMPWEVPTVLAPNVISAGGCSIWRWENANRSQVLYDTTSPGKFGGFLPGDGYWFFLNTIWPVSYKGLDNTIPQWTTLPNTGNIWLGLPKSTAVSLADIQVHDGASVRTYRDGSQHGQNWFAASGFRWDNTLQSQKDVGLAEDYPTGGTSWQPWDGISFIVYTTDKAWIIP